MPVDGESLGLPPRPVEREHELGAEPLAEGMLHGERLQLRHERELTAECEFRVDSFLNRGEAQLLEALDLHTCEWLELEVGERLPSQKAIAALSASAAANVSPAAGDSRPAAARRSKCSRSSSPGSTRSR